MYPDLERYNDCDTEYRGNSFFEQNCNQIFTKGPALTKDFLGKVNAEIVPKKTYIFGREFKTKRILRKCFLVFKLELKNNTIYKFHK